MKRRLEDIVQVGGEKQVGNVKKTKSHNEMKSGVPSILYETSNDEAPTATGGFMDPIFHSNDQRLSKKLDVVKGIITYNHLGSLDIWYTGCPN